MAIKVSLKKQLRATLEYLALKNILYFLMLLVLVAGACTTLGFLSSGGVLALGPTLPAFLVFLEKILVPLAIGFGILAVAYEGEIYLQNIKGAFNKLFYKQDYTKRFMANEFLLKHFPNDLSAPDCPEFFRDYDAQLRLLHQFGHKNLDKSSKARKKQVEKTIKDMEKWFAMQLHTKSRAEEPSSSEPPSLLPAKAEEGFLPKSSLDIYQQQLQTWLQANHQNEAIHDFKKRRQLLIGVNIFSVLSGLFMGWGTSYLLVGQFAAIPVLASISLSTLPFLIVPMSVLAGAAYGFLTYNAITDMINNDTLRKRFYKMRDDFKQGVTWRNVLLAATAGTLVVLAVALTCCTAGTWWTVAKNAQPLFSWMAKLPIFIMSVVNPVITGFSAVIFNLQNTAETFDLLDDISKPKGNIFTRLMTYTHKQFAKVYQRENLLQLLNPFRILLMCTHTPLRIILFLLHLMSIGFTGDRIPYIPELLSAGFVTFSELFEDLRYFVDYHAHSHKHDTQSLLKERLEAAAHGHDHSADLPTKLLNYLFSPLFLLAAFWANWTSQLNAPPLITDGEVIPPPLITDAEVIPSPLIIDGEVIPPTPQRPVLTFKEAWKQQTGQKPECSVELAKDSVHPSESWKGTQLDFLIERYKQKQLDKAYYEPQIAEEKIAALNNIQANVRTNSDIPSMKQYLANAAADPIFNRHRFFDHGDKTRTQVFVELLPERIDLVCPAA